MNLQGYCQIADINGSWCAALRVTVRPAAADLPEYAILFEMNYPVDLLGLIARREIQEVPLGRRCVIGRRDIHDDSQLL
jgi:hypothetical protein